MTSKEVRTLIVDDHPAFLDAAARVLAATAGFRSVGEVPTPEAALAIAARERPELAIVDVRMPLMDGIELTERLRATSPTTTVMLISAELPERIPAAAGRCGAVAVLRKQDFGVDLLRRAWARHL